MRKQATGRCHKSHRENNHCWHPAEREEPARHSRTCASHGVRGDHGALPLCPGRPRRREATEWRGGGTACGWKHLSLPWCDIPTTR